MSSPTETEVKTQIGNAVKILEEMRKFGHVNATNFVSLEDTLLQSIETDWAAEVTAGERSVRAGLNAGMVAGADMVSPLFLQYAKTLGLVAEDAQAAFDQVYQNYVDNSKTVNARQFSYGSPAAGGANVGNGTLKRLNVDANGFFIENQTADAKLARCIADEHSGAQKHEEVFSLEGAGASRDFIQITGSGKRGEIRAASARDSLRFIGNPSFSQYDGTIAVPTAITNWTVTTSLANFEIVTSSYYRDFVGDTTPSSVKFKANDKLTQNLNVQSATFDPNVPVNVRLAYNREVGLGDGTLTLRWGSTSVNVVLAAQTGWNLLEVSISLGSWYDSFITTTPTIEVELSGRTTGYVLVDDIVVTPFTAFDGGWYVLVGGATPFLRDDTFTWTDSIATDAILQQWFWRLFGRYLPSNTGGTETWVDP